MCVDAVGLWNGLVRMAFYSLTTRVPFTCKNNANWFSSKLNGSAGCSNSSDDKLQLNGGASILNANSGAIWSHSWASEIIAVEHQQRSSIYSGTGFSNIELRGREANCGLNRFRNQRRYHLLGSKLNQSGTSSFAFGHHFAHTISGYSSNSSISRNELIYLPNRNLHSSSTDHTECVRRIENGDTFEEPSSAVQRKLEPPSPDDIECLEQLENGNLNNKIKLVSNLNLQKIFLQISSLTV